jgi:hypothetical protein
MANLTEKRFTSFSLRMPSGEIQRNVSQAAGVPALTARAAGSEDLQRL